MRPARASAWYPGEELQRTCNHGTTLHPGVRAGRGRLREESRRLRGHRVVGCDGDRVKIFPVIALALIVVGALVAGCSSSGASGHAGTSASTPSSAPPIAAGARPCAYLTASEVHEFGDHVSYPGKPGDQDYGPTCDYGGAVFTLIKPA